jgi:SprT protein
LVLPFEAAVAERPLDALERVRCETTRYLERAAERWPQVLGPVSVNLALRGRSAGDACGRTGAIRYNGELLARHGDAFLAEIVPHEVAHVVVARAFPGRRRPHGPEWREVMGYFGVRARSCHSFETTPARRVGSVPYRCACPDTHLLTPRAHRRIRRGFATYHCRKCRQALVWVGSARGAAPAIYASASSSR